MKTTIYLIISCLGLFFLSCETEKLIDSTPEKYITSEKISLEQVLSEIESPIINQFSKDMNSGAQVGISQKSSTNTNTYFTKIVKGTEYTTYLMLVNSYSLEKPYFMYYVITKEGLEEKAGYLKYIPNLPIPFVNEKTFTGKIQMLDLNKNIKTDNNFVNGKAQKQTTSATGKSSMDCVTTMELITHNCGLEGNHSPGEYCQDGVSRGYYELAITNTCYLESMYVSFPVPNHLMNLNENTNGGGGPNTISDYTLFFEGILSIKQKMWWDYNNNDVQKQEIIAYLEQNSTGEGILFAMEMIDQMRTHQGLILDINASSKSPANIDRSGIPFDFTKPENQKFNELYDVLTTSPTFKKLFIDIFQDSKRFNVKFEIAEHVYEGNDPTKKEVHATTSQDPVTKNLTIKISKQILTADGTMSQTKIENVKTILHECIHAYLFTISSNPLVGKDIAEVINTVLPTVAEQHDFMYNKMIPTMQKVLGEIRDLVTTTDGRAVLDSQYTMHPTTNPLTSTSWIWNEYFKYLSIKGLEEASFYKVDFIKESDPWKLLSKYIEYGHDQLKP